MLRQSPSRNSRMKGFKLKAKRAGQICLLLTIFMWLLHQVRNLHYSSKEHKEPSPKLLPNGVEMREMIIKLGRKDMYNPLSDASLVKGSQDKDKEPGEDIRGVQEAEEEEEEEDTVEGRGLGDDEIDVNDQERAEEEDSESELEDLIDEEDQEKEEASLEEETEGHMRRATDSQGLTSKLVHRT